MRIASVAVGSDIQPAVEVAGALYAWSDVVPGYPGASVQDVLPHLCNGGVTVEVDDAQPLAPDTPVLAPLPRPRRDLICLGKNFAEHATEFNLAMQQPDEIPTAPIIFTKATTTVCANGADVTVDPALTEEVDYEGELAAVIGRQAREIGPEDALAHVAGYTILNDLTARDLQHRHQQWFVGKSLDGFGPMGPVLVSSDELGNPADLQVATYVDGELRQQAPTSTMIFDVPFVVSFLSRVLTLEVGDIIAMGTPKGVGVGFDPPRLLEDGSVVEIEISKIGRLSNTIRFRSSHALSR